MTFHLGDFPAEDAALAIDGLERVALYDEFPEIRKFALASLPHLPQDRAFDAWMRLTFTPETPLPEGALQVAQELASRTYAPSRWNARPQEEARSAQARRALMLAERMKTSLEGAGLDPGHPAYDALYALAERAFLWLEDPREKERARELTPAR